MVTDYIPARESPQIYEPSWTLQASSTNRQATDRQGLYLMVAVMLLDGAQL
jgi:hypothetical protein